MQINGFHSTTKFKCIGPLSIALSTLAESISLRMLRLIDFKLFLVLFFAFDLVGGDAPWQWDCGTDYTTECNLSRWWSSWWWRRWWCVDCCGDTNIMCQTWTRVKFSGKYPVNVVFIFVSSWAQNALLFYVSLLVGSLAVSLVQTFFRIPRWNRRVNIRRWETLKWMLMSWAESKLNRHTHHTHTNWFQRIFLYSTVWAGSAVIWSHGCVIRINKTQFVFWFLLVHLFQFYSIPSVPFPSQYTQTLFPYKLKEYNIVYWWVASREIQFTIRSCDKKNVWSKVDLVFDVHWE